MIEIRNDEIADEHGQSVWAERLARLLQPSGHEQLRPLEKAS
jgi:predicted N-formylglutamate amidohydrolase